MKEIIKEQIPCKYLKESVSTEFKFKGKQIIWTKFNCPYIGRKTDLGYCYKVGKETCEIIEEFQNYVNELGNFIHNLK